MKTKDIAIIAIFTAFLFVQEQALNFIPNVSFTTFLIILYCRLLNLEKTFYIVIIYTLLDALYMGSSPIAIPFMMMGWLIIPLLLCTVFKEKKGVKFLTMIGFFHGFIYGWINIPAGLMITELPFLAYLMADIPFELIMAFSNLIAVALLYEPLYNRLNPMLNPGRED